LPASLPMSSPTGFGYTEFHYVVDQYRNSEYGIRNTEYGIRNTHHAR
jgi:hypothetical protein